MKRKKLRALIEFIHERERAVPQRPVVVDSLVVDFDARQVSFRGRVIRPETSAVVFPVLSTDRLVVPANGHDVL